MWSYIRHLRETQAPASRAVSLLESIRFCHFTMGVDGAQSVLESLRVKGLASQLYASKKPWKPSDVLSVSDVEFLHHCFMDGTRSDVDRVIIGHFLHLLYARARFSDMLSVTGCFLDEEGAFLEVSATLHKGAKSMDSKSRLLPIVAPARGICGGNWAKAYLQLRHRAGLSEPGAEAGPMLMAPNRGGLGWSDRYITSQELNKFMKNLFLAGGRTIVGRKVTTHSFKATSLSWCSKLGVTPEDRAVLARHASSVKGATPLYSRDLISSAMRVFVGMLEAIRAQTFFPDRTRSGMVTPAMTTPVGAPSTPLPPVQAPIAQVVPTSPVERSVHVVGEESSQKETSRSTGKHVGSPEANDGCSYTPGTPASEVPVKEEFVWPQHDWDDTVIDLEEQHDLLEAWQDGSEEESSSCDNSESDSDLGWDNVDESEDLVHAAPVVQPQWFINAKTMVIHEVRVGSSFRCGRVNGPSYVPVHELNGLRCGKCFAGRI